MPLPMSQAPAWLDTTDDVNERQKGSWSMIKPIRRALVSVYDKTGLVELGEELAKAGVEIVSTGSTASVLRDHQVPVTPVEEVTGFPECLDGRVKTLHPKVHAGILANLDLPDHVNQLQQLGVRPFDLIVVNLYPFEDTVASGADYAECIEKIDIGGPTMIRAAAKNHAHIAVVTSPDQYVDVIAALNAGGTSAQQRQIMARDAFQRIFDYDEAIADWFFEQTTSADGCCGGCGCQGLDESEDGSLPEILVEPCWEKAADLRYGENPHQKAALYIPAEFDSDDGVDTDQDATEAGVDVNAIPAGEGLARAIQLGGKEMSFNNYTDSEAALRAAYDHPDQACVAIIKHANPCGIAIADDIAEAHRKAHACDPVSAYGGVIAANREVTAEMAAQVKPIFTEVIIAPSFEPEAVEILRSKKNLRILKVIPPTRGELEYKRISGGLLVQRFDDVDDRGDDPSNWTLVAGAAADEATMADLVFAWHSVRAVKSNAILLVKDGASVGVGMGQVNRVDSAKLAVERANTLGSRSTGDAAADTTEITSAGGARSADIVSDKPEQRAIGSVAASDAFFPFADGLTILIEAGVKAVVQPGGSIRDDEVIAAANEAGITMYFTGNRHFFH